MGMGLCTGGGIVLLIKPGATLPLELGLISSICTSLQRLLIFIVPDPKLFSRNNSYRKSLTILSRLGYLFFSIGIIWIGIGVCKFLFS